MKPFWMVLGSGLPVYRHSTEESAKKESIRLAGSNPGKEFVVLKAIGGVHFEPVYRELPDPDVVEVVDRLGNPIRPGERVWVNYSNGYKSKAVVVGVFPDRPTRNQPGHWVDVSINNKGPEGIPSYILEVDVPF